MLKTVLVIDVPAKQRAKPTTTTKTKQQFLAEEVFRLQITKSKGEKILPYIKIKHGLLI